jgi:enolase-phosphatase E1
VDPEIKYILTDIEGTTSSVSFVYDVLFPYFKAHLSELPKMANLAEVKHAFAQVIEIVKEEEGKHITTTEEVMDYLVRWNDDDRKITPLKTLQGIIWKMAYETGEIKGHVFDDVPTCLNQWRIQGIKVGVFSSGSVAAQKLLFRHSCFGDLSAHFSNHFDTTTGPKRAPETYQSIAAFLGLEPHQILFLSDIREELEAATKVGLQTVQLVRPGTKVAWDNTVADFTEL